MNDTPEKEPIVLKVGTATIVEELATAITTCYEKHKQMPNLRCIGASALNQAFKAVIVSNGYFSQRGLIAVIVPNFGDVTEDNRTVTCLNLNLQLKKVQAIV